MYMCVCVCALQQHTVTKFIGNSLIRALKQHHMNHFRLVQSVDCGRHYCQNVEINLLRRAPTKQHWCTKKKSTNIPIIHLLAHTYKHNRVTYPQQRSNQHSNSNYCNNRQGCHSSIAMCSMLNAFNLIKIRSQFRISSQFLLLPPLLLLPVLLLWQSLQSLLWLLLAVVSIGVHYAFCAKTFGIISQGYVEILLCCIFLKQGKKNQ